MIKRKKIEPVVPRWTLDNDAAICYDGEIICNDDIMIVIYEYGLNKEIVYLLNGCKARL
jgi:hypothetical protein